MISRDSSQIVNQLDEYTTEFDKLLVKNYRYKKLVNVEKMYMLCISYLSEEEMKIVHPRPSKCRTTLNAIKLIEKSFIYAVLSTG